MEFISNIIQSFWFVSGIKLILGFILSGIIGLERSSWNKPAGFRTHSLVGISAVLIMICGEYMSGQYNIDPSRISAQLLSGIGFIGAGTILRDGFNVKGLTTAASLLAVTCIGLSIGAGFYFGGILTTIIVYILLSYSYIFSDKLEHFRPVHLTLIIEKDTKEMLQHIQKVLEKNDITIKQIKQEASDVTQDEIYLYINGQYNKRTKMSVTITNLASLEGVKEVTEEVK